MKMVHKDCPPNGCDICQHDWPCAKLSAQRVREQQQAAQDRDEARIRRIVCEELIKLVPNGPHEGRGAGLPAERPFDAVVGRRRDEERNV